MLRVDRLLLAARPAEGVERVSERRRSHMYELGSVIEGARASWRTKASHTPGSLILAAWAIEIDDRNGLAKSRDAGRDDPTVVDCQSHRSVL